MIELLKKILKAIWLLLGIILGLTILAGIISFFVQNSQM